MCVGEREKRERENKHVTTGSKPLAQGRLREKEIRIHVQGVLARDLGNSVFSPTGGRENSLRPRRCKTTATRAKKEHFSKYQEVAQNAGALRRK